MAALAGSLVGPASVARAAGPCPSVEPCIVVHVVGANDSTQVVSLTDLDTRADLTSPAYQTRARPDQSPQGEPRPGRALSVRHLLESLPTPVAPGSVTFTESPNRSGGTSYLRGRTHDLDQPGGPAYPFQDGLMPAVYVVGSNDAIGYIRPLRGGDDTNAADFWQTNNGGALELTVHTTGDVVTPTLHATPSTTKVGEQVAFTVTLDEQPTRSLSYTWQFGDGASVTTSAPQTSHAYGATGTSYASVVVRGDDGTVGQSAPVLVTVGARPPTQQGTPRPGTGTSTKPPAPATGPDHGTGGRAGSRPGRHPSAGATGGAGGGGGATPATPGPTQGASPDAAPAAPTAAPTATRTPTTKPRPARSQPAAPTPVKRLPRSVAQADGTVEGVVIGGPEVLQAAASPTRTLTADTASAARRGRHAGVADAVGWSAAVALLLGLGAAGEARGPRRRRRRPA